MENSNDIEKLTNRIKHELGHDSTRWIPVGDGYSSVALAILNSIYSTGKHFSGVLKVIDRYADLREKEGHDAWSDTSANLIEVIERWGGPEGFAVKTKNQWKTSSASQAPLKAYAAYEAAKVLQKHDINNRDDARAQFADRDVRENADVSQEWKAITSQRSGLTWHYFLMLMGIPGVKADRMIRRFVTESLGRDQSVSVSEASTLVEAVADELDISYSQLDHTIWRFTSGREFLIAGNTESSVETLPPTSSEADHQESMED